MAKLSRVDDTNSGGGKIMRGARTVWAEGRPVGLHTSTITPHAPWNRKRHPPHRAATTTEGSPTVWAEGEPVLRVGSGVSCGHPINSGCERVEVE